MFGRTMKTLENLKNQMVVMFGLMLMCVETAFASGSAYDSDRVNEQAKGVAQFLTDLLQGWVGYTLALAVFFIGVFMYFKDKNLWGTLACFGIAIMIVFVPGMLEGFFDVA